MHESTREEAGPVSSCTNQLGRNWPMVLSFNHNTSRYTRRVKEFLQLHFQSCCMIWLFGADMQIEQLASVHDGDHDGVGRIFMGRAYCQRQALELWWTKGRQKGSEFCTIIIRLSQCITWHKFLYTRSVTLDSITLHYVAQPSLYQECNFVQTL